MILTGRALEDFTKWNYDNDFGYIDHEPTSLVVHFEDLDENLRNTIIVDWFDSVGIQIEIKIFHWSKGYEFSPTIYTNFIHEGNLSATCCIDRKTAIKQAIIKANDIYNENKA